MNDVSEAQETVQEIINTSMDSHEKEFRENMISKWGEVGFGFDGTTITEIPVDFEEAYEKFSKVEKRIQEYYEITSKEISSDGLSLVAIPKLGAGKDIEIKIRFSAPRYVPHTVFHLNKISKYPEHTISTLRLSNTYFSPLGEHDYTGERRDFKSLEEFNSEDIADEMNNRLITVLGLQYVLKHIEKQ